MQEVALVRAGGDAGEVAAACRRALDLAGGLTGRIRPGQRVLVKPNLVAPVPAAVTDRNVLAEVVRAVKELGATPIIGACPGFEYDSRATFHALGIRDLAASLGVEALNFEEDEHVEVPFDHPRVRRVGVARAAIECDAIVNVPKMKCHKLTDVSLSIKNCFGMLEKSSRREVHAKGLHRGIAALYRLFRPAMNVIEGLTVPTSGAVYGGYRGFGALGASPDMLALDVAVARLLGFEPSGIAHIALASPSRLPEVQLVGDGLDPLVLRKRGVRLGRSVYRLAFAALYWVDHHLGKASQNSIIPWFHTRFGVHPAINWGKCDLCEKCLPACPVGAIDLGRKRLDYALCGKARCLACVDVCPQAAVSVKRALR